MLLDVEWTLYEQVAIAAMDCQHFDVAKDCLRSLRSKFPESSTVGVELFFTYVSARSSFYLGGILTQPLTTGGNIVELVINPPHLEMIPEDTMMQPALLIMRARYQGAFFMIAPFYVYYEYDHYLLRRFPPTRGVFVLRIHRYVYLLIGHIAYIS